MCAQLTRDLLAIAKFLYIYIFIRSEEAASKKTNDRKQLQTNVKKEDRHLHIFVFDHGIISPEMLLTSPYRKKVFSVIFFQVIDIVDLTSRKYYTVFIILSQLSRDLRGGEDVF